MPLYSYVCTNPDCGARLDIFHPIREVGSPRACGGCGAPLQRRLTPVHHRWPAQYRPGFEESGQRMLLDPEFQARKKDELAQAKEEHLNRTAREKGQDAHGSRR